MIPREKQVVSFELAKRLKDLGFPQDSLFCHIAGCVMTTDDYSTTIMDCSAYTVAELGEMLPKEITNSPVKHYYYRQIHGAIGYWRDMYDCLVSVGLSDSTEADTRAKMLIWLKENKYI